MENRRFRLFGGRLFDKAFSSSRVWGQLIFMVVCCLLGITVLYVLGGVADGAVDGFLKDALKSLGVDGARLRRVVSLMLDPGVFADSHEVPMMPELWQLVITLCGAVVFLALVINAFGNVVDNRVEAYRKGLVRYRFRNHVVFLGANEVVIGMIDHLATVPKFRKKKFVVFSSADCESVRDNVTSHLSEEAKKLDITFMYGERNDVDALYSIYVDRASHIYIVGEDNEPEHDSLSVECWNMVKDIRQKAAQQYPGMIAKCYLVLDRQSSTWVFNKMNADPASGIETNVIDTLESLAQRVLVNPKPEDGRQAPPTLDGPDGIRYEDEKTVHLVVLGMTQMASAIAMTAAHLCHFPNYLRDNSKKTLITFISPDADKEMAFMKGRYTHLFRLSEYEYHEKGQAKPVCHKPKKDFLDVKWEFVKGSVEQDWVRDRLLKYYESHKSGKERLTLAVCGNDAESNIASALYLPEQFYVKKRESGCDDVTILVYQPVSGERISTACLKTYRYSNLYPFGQHDGSYDPSYRARLLAAKKINYLYDQCYHKTYQRMPDKSELSVLDKHWYGKSFLERASSMFSANSIYVKLRSVGLTSDSPKKALKPYVDLLSEVEHNRWDIERLIMGVSDLTDAQQAEAVASPEEYKHWKVDLHMNKNIIPYDELDEDTKEFDKVIVQNMLDVVK